MTSKPRRYFCLTENDLVFMKTFCISRGIKNLSDALTILIQDYKSLINQISLLKEENISMKQEYAQDRAIIKAAARDSRLSLMILDTLALGQPITTYLLENNESPLLQSARIAYKKELEAARTKKSNGD